MTTDTQALCIVIAVLIANAALFAAFAPIFARGIYELIAEHLRTRADKRYTANLRRHSKSFLLDNGFERAEVRIKS